VLFALLLVLAARALRGAALYAAAGAGLVAAFIYAWHPAWSYGVVIETLAHAHTGMMTGLASALMLFAGATLGALLQHRWRLAPLEPLRAARCLAGGFVMGWGAHLVPGGNDMLLLWAIPGLALYGLLAYLVMLVTVAALLCLPQLLRPAASGAQLPP
jgi:toxin CptA